MRGVALYCVDGYSHSTLTFSPSGSFGRIAGFYMDNSARKGGTYGEGTRASCAWLPPHNFSSPRYLNIYLGTAAVWWPNILSRPGERRGALGARQGPAGGNEDVPRNAEVLQRRLHRGESLEGGRMAARAPITIPSLSLLHCTIRAHAIRL